jgi:Mlc titration factor MtfA (ptsG expression regulator)
MADTIWYNSNGISVPYDSLPDSVKQIIEQVRQDGYLDTPAGKHDDGSYTPFILVMSIVVVAAFVGVKRAWKEKGTILLGSGSSRRPSVVDQRSQDLQDQLHREYNVYEGRDIVIPGEQVEKILQKHSLYYRRLAPELRERFQQRIREFMGEKTFLIKSNEPFVEMPVLLSAAAVQLTFGLDKYELPFFQYIRIFPEEYFAGDESLRVLAGHVYGNTITVAWNQFLKGFEEYNDGVNLGLHEMSHALYFQFVEADSGRSRKFAEGFKEVMEEGAEVYELKHAKPCELFTKNAYRNLQEFWAESVELFFERPSDLRRENTELYDAIKELLNQDPVNTLYPILEESA